MYQIGVTFDLLPCDGEFRKLARTYHAVMVATLYSLLGFVFLKGEYEIFDVNTFEMSKVTFRWMMGILAALMGSTYFIALVVRDYYKAIRSLDRIYEEMAM